MLCVFNSFLAPFEKQFPVTGMWLESSKCEPSWQLNGLLPSDVVQGVLEWKDFHCIEMAFPFIFANTGIDTECIEDAGLMKVNKIYFELRLEFYSRGSKRNMYFKTWMS